MYYMKVKILKSLFPFTKTLFNRERTLIGGLPYTVSKLPSFLMHADIADIRFFSKSAVDPKHCLLAVDLSTSKTYTYQ